MPQILRIKNRQRVGFNHQIPTLRVRIKSPIPLSQRKPARNNQALKMSEYRDLLCGSVGKKELGKNIKLCGWVHRRRDHGGVIFIDLRDHTGLVQIVFDPADKELFALAEHLRSEFVIAVEGEVAKRPQESINPEIATGDLELMVKQCQILNRAEGLAFTAKEHEHANEDLRLANRVIDLRRGVMQDNLRLRSKIAFMLREFLDQLDFVEIETPMLTKETPEGARDYLVPSRTNPGSFFALPQSPQLFKQLLMIGGFNRYYQFARCFRDEDLRADRQPEFTQLDIEMAFTNEEEIMSLMEEMITKVFKEFLDVELPQFPRMSYEEAMNRYGSDRPDLRSPLELKDITELVKDCGFKVFSQPAQDKGGKVVVMRVPSKGEISRKDIDDWTDYTRELGAKGLAYIRIEDLSKGMEGLNSPIIKFLGEETVMEIIKECEAQDGDILFFGADKAAIACKCLGNLRLKISAKLNLLEDGWRPLWVTDFPMFEETDDGTGITPTHHPFTSPADENNMDNPLEMKSRAYDLVINGTELGGGSIRINKPEVQEKMFRILGIKNWEEKFGFLIRALKFGAPPHGGIAFGFDRLLMLITKGESIRDYIAFPKTQSATCLLTNAPSMVEPRHLRELGIRIMENNKEANGGA